ncbi:MAG TPA: hypothetical protein VJ742_12300 [Nitrososphaera sp.]|nr:hypothetical protein [Nitrososphaera sp.]
MEFTETLTLEIPHIEDKLAEFAESDFNSKNGLIIEVAAIHEGITANYNSYSADELKDALPSWTEPYRKPILLHHDPTSEAIGRVIAAKMDYEADGTPYVRLQVAISDASAIEKIKDQRYLTGSVGGRAQEANCSICNADWANASMFNLPCKHSRGKAYEGKIATINMKKISFKEYSFVNMPADSRSSVLQPAESDDWVRPARFFSLPLGQESIYELTEGQSVDILSGVRKKEALPIYHGLRGAFLSALAENDSEENGMAEATEEEVEDILAVAEELSADLAKPEEVEEEEQEEATDETETEETEEDSEDEEEVEDSTDEEESTEDEPEEEEKKPQGQEKKRVADVDPEDSKGADKTREDEEGETETETVEEEDSTEAEEEVTKLKEANEALELLVAELKARNETLLTENTRLKTALKKGLAERVVDTKITLGLAKGEDREELLEEHLNRSASSLADSLRDLVSMPKITSTERFPTVEPISAAVSGEEGTEIVDVEESEPAKSLDPEDVLVDVFMGRRSLP